MEDQAKKGGHLWIWAIVAVLVVGGAVYAGMRIGASAPVNQALSNLPEASGGAASPSAAVPATTTNPGSTRQPLTQNIATPAAGDTAAPVNVAVPTNVANLGSGSGTGSMSLRHFIISGLGGQYSPNTIVVNNGDVVDLTLKAVDGAYGIYFPDFGISLTASKGEIAHAQFQTSGVGQYTFYCKDVCSGNPTGTLIVNK